MAESPLAHSPTLVAPDPALESERLVPGTTVGEYEIERFVGAGAMGDVYAGRHPVIGKRVAIKVLKRELMTDPDAAVRFIREARAAIQIDHPNVINIFAFNRLDDGRLYLAMDLVEGRSLRATIRDNLIDVPAALDVLDQIASAIDAAHSHGVVHRDLKPDNVMLGKGTPPKVFVLDFGLAKLLAGAGGSQIGDAAKTGKGAWVGTPGYMAPEQWSADGAGPASDRYALGVMAFELLSGKLPFEAPSLPQMMEQHFRAPVPALSARGAVGINAAIDPVLARAMAKNPEERFATARELVEALRAAAEGKFLANRPLPRRLWAPAGAGAGVLALAVGAVVLTRGPSSTTRDSTRTDEEDRRPGPTDTVHLAITSSPPKASVRRGGVELGLTPASVEAHADEDVTVEIRKPGYRSVEKKLKAPKEDGAAHVNLEPISAFEGVWGLPNGQLRAFQRDGDAVDVYKLDTIDGQREFYRKMDFVDAAIGVAFAANEAVTDARGADDPSCQIAHKVEYRYDPVGDTLEVHPERVETGRRSGHCFVVRREPGMPIRLVRVDRDTSDTRWSSPPVGKPRLRAKDPDKNVDVKDVKALKAAELSKTQSSLDDGGKTTRKPPSKPAPIQPQTQGPSKTVKAPPPVGTGSGNAPDTAVGKPKPATKAAPKAPPTKKSKVADDVVPVDDGKLDNQQAAPNAAPPQAQQAQVPPPPPTVKK